ncbi:hypothetical protein AMTRI_Chr05g70240 [Amborella trichopoda]
MATILRRSILHRHPFHTLPSLSTSSPAPAPAPAPTPTPTPTSTPTPSPSRFLRHFKDTPPESSDHLPFLRFPQTRISTIRNSGLRVITQSSLSSRTATVGVWIDAGSRYEAPGTNGTAHFLEHMLFKGTRRRTARGLEEEIENMGARLNAYTSREQTTFYANVLEADVNAAIDVLADILQNSRFSENAILQERAVILREMEEVHSQTEELIFDHLHSAAFQQSPLGNTILGFPENIRTISKVDLLEYITTHYSGSRMVISAAGAIRHEDIVNQVKRLFNRLNPDPTTVAQLVRKDPSVFTAAETRVVNDDMSIAHFAVAFKGASWTDPYSIPLMVIQSLLGSWNKSVGVGNCSGSELARRVGTHDLAESIMAFNTNYQDVGLFGIYATAMLKSALMLHIDGSSSIAENNGRQLLTYGRIVPFVELFARIDAVDADAVKQAAHDFIIDKDVAIAALGPIQRLPSYNRFRSQTCTL